MKSKTKKTKVPIMKPLKARTNPASSDSKTSIRKVTPSIIPEEKPSPKTKLLSPGLNKTPNTPPTPVEALGRYYAEAFGIETLCLRIGSFVEADRPIVIRYFATLLAHSDCVSLINACLCAKGVLFDIFYGVSANTWRFWDTSHARDVLGWIPQVNAERFR